MAIPLSVSQLNLTNQSVTASGNYLIVNGYVYEPAPVISQLTGTSPLIVFSGIRQINTINLIGNTVFSATGFTPNSQYELVLSGDATRTLGWPNFTWLENITGGPQTLASGKVMEVSLRCNPNDPAPTATSVIAVYAVQP